MFISDKLAQPCPGLGTARILAETYENDCRRKVGIGSLRMLTQKGGGSPLDVGVI